MNILHLIKNQMQASHIDNTDFFKADQDNISNQLNDMILDTKQILVIQHINAKQKHIFIILEYFFFSLEIVFNGSYL